MLALVFNNVMSGNGLKEIFNFSKDVKEKIAFVSLSFFYLLFVFSVQYG